MEMQNSLVITISYLGALKTQDLSKFSKTGSSIIYQCLTKNSILLPLHLIFEALQKSALMQFVVLFPRSWKLISDPFKPHLSYLNVHKEQF